MKIVVAIDSFKGSLTAVQTCEIVANAIRSVAPQTEVVTKPMADGGEGTASVLMAAAGGQWISRTVMGPLPDMQVDAGFVWLPRSEDGGQEIGRVALSEDPEIGTTQATRMGGSVKAEGLGDGEWANHRQAALDAATQDSTIREPADATAMIEMATAGGLQLLRPEQRNPLKTTTYGVGQLIKAAIDYGARRILLAIGGSATVDGGVGAAMALGWRFLAADEQEIGLGGGELSRIARIVAPVCSVPVRASRSTGIPRSGRGQALPVILNHGQDAHATETPHGVTTNEASRLPSTAAVEVLCDVDNPLCGEHGAARVYGPQKGATPAMVEMLDAGLAHLAKVVREQLGRDIAEVPGAGAAGGLAAGAIAFMDARLVCGIDTVMAQTRLQEAVAGADWVLTGEGSFDEQSLRGKVVSGVLRVAKAAGAKVAVLAGQVRLSAGQYRQAGIETAVSCMEDGMDVEYAIAHGQMLLDRAARRFVRDNVETKETYR